MRSGSFTTKSPVTVCTLLEIDRKSTRLNSSHLVISYAVFCLKKKKPNFEELERASAGDAPWSRHNLVRILFVHRSVPDVEWCMFALEWVRFTVSSDVFVTPET